MVAIKTRWKCGWKKILTFLLGIVILSGVMDCFLPQIAEAATKRTVKVAFFPMDGYHIKLGEQNYDGMDVQYLKALCEYADWKVEYVECASWDEALALLSAQKVDLVGSAQFSEERSEIYQYASLPSGYTFGVIAAKGDSSFAYEDFEAMKEITFGMVKTYVRKNEFLQYLEDNGVRNPSIKTYDTTAELQEALNRGEIDVYIHTFTEIQEGQRLIGRFAPMPFYYITYPGNDDVMRELNQAVADLKISRPELETELMNKFYQSKLDKTVVFSTEEKKYIAETGTVTVGYLDGYYPFSYEEDGDCKGLTRQLLDGGLASAGLKVKYRKFDDSANARKALEEGAVDILSYCTDSKEELNRYGFTMIREYAEIPLVTAMKEDGKLGEVEKLAIVSYLEDKAGLAFDLDTVKFQCYDTQQECLDAVVKGEADAVLCDGYLSEYLMGTELSYSKMEIKSVINGEHHIAIAVRNDQIQLAGILNKITDTIDARQVSEYMLESNVYALMSFERFLRSHSIEINGFLLAVVVIVVLTAYKMIKGSRKIQKLMYKDTGMDIWNLNYLIYQGESKLLPEKKERKYTVVCLNISQFRRYNIIYGWNAGQKLLEAVAECVAENIDEKSEICARSQGDRFVLLLNYKIKEAFLQRLAQMEETIERCIYQATENHMALQMGVYLLPPQSDDLRVAVNYATQTLEFMKDSRLSDVMVYDEALEQMFKQRHQREKLLEAVDIDENFVAYYQAKVDIRSERVIGAEALIRFLDPTADGVVRSPGFFVPYYEQTGRVTEIDFFVLNRVCQMLQRRIKAGKNVVTISCNFSRLHFLKPDFPERFEEVLNRYGVPKELIEVEITETIVVEELQQQIVKQTLDVLRERGVRLSIDDFGSGYSSLGVFEQIPASVIKLDRSFLLNQKDRSRQVKIMKGIVNLAQELDAQIVCEGVETDRDVELMQEVGAYVAQGYRYAKPVPEEEFERRLDENQFGV
ncbi:EAL domain-containing protein [Lachnospiraceae bacterium 45-W7]